ncbi:hypothetical protein FACS1894127_4920 [Clostridia bacterium]|nr:hypothetical protein FACS1894127_4920 [Clostridia bacterium]
MKKDRISKKFLAWLCTAALALTLLPLSATPVLAAATVIDLETDITEDGNGYTVMVSGSVDSPTVITLDGSNPDGYRITGDGGDKYRVEVAAPDSSAANPVRVTLDGVSIVEPSSYSPLSVTNGTTAHITLVGENILTAPMSSAGLNVPGHPDDIPEHMATAVIDGTGSLIATAGDYASGIGGSNGQSAGVIQIISGNITARGGNLSAGIGGSEGAHGGIITIAGDAKIIEAIGGAEGAGIGGSAHGHGGNITIAGGAEIIKAQGGIGSPGIGGGHSGHGGIITIANGAKIIEAKGISAAGIGGGNNGGDGVILNIEDGAMVRVYSTSGRAIQADGDTNLGTAILQNNYFDSAPSTDEDVTIHTVPDSGKPDVVLPQGYRSFSYTVPTATASVQQFYKASTQLFETAADIAAVTDTAPTAIKQFTADTAATSVQLLAADTTVRQSAMVGGVPKAITIAGGGGWEVPSQRTSLSPTKVELAPANIVSYVSEGSGVVKPDYDIVKDGYSYTVRPKPTRTDRGFRFDYWDGGSLGQLIPGAEFMMPASDVTLTAHWTPITAPTITLPSRLGGTVPLPGETAALSGGGLGAPFSLSLTATGDSPITWSIVPASGEGLPNGLTLSGSGEISGTPTVTGTFTFTVKASNGGSTDATQKLSITINADPPDPPTPVGTAPGITAASPLPYGIIGTAYSRTLTATGATPVTWSIVPVTGEALPPGLILSANGVISGTPTATGTFSFTVKAANGILPEATKTLTIAIHISSSRDGNTNSGGSGSSYGSGDSGIGIISGSSSKSDISSTGTATDTASGALDNGNQSNDQSGKHIAYINGYTDGTIHPDGFLTRAEAAMIFYQLDKGADKAAAQVPQFTDVKAGAWYAQAVDYLGAKGVLNGRSDGLFYPEAQITRGELTAIIEREHADPKQADNPFSDLTTKHWAYSYILSAMAKGWISGYSDLTFRPEQNITRAETIRLVNGWQARRHFAPDFATLHLSPFSDLPGSHWAYNDIVEASDNHAYHFDEQGAEIWDK